MFGEHVAIRYVMNSMTRYHEPSELPSRLAKRLPNQRMKLTWRGGRSKGNESILMAAAAPRSLCAIR